MTPWEPRNYHVDPQPVLGTKGVGWCIGTSRSSNPFRCRCEDLWHSWVFFFFLPSPWPQAGSMSLEAPLLSVSVPPRWTRPALPAPYSTSTERTIQGHINNKNIQSCFSVCVCGLFLSVCLSKCLFFPFISPPFVAGGMFPLGLFQTSS